MKRTFLTVIVAVLLASLAAPAALANDGAVGTQGGAVRPIGSTDVRMDSEAVQILCLDAYALYRIDFKFVNSAPDAKTVKLGFPFPDFENNEFENTGEPPGAFRAWLDGEELAVAQERGKDSDGEGEWDVIWFTHTATFPPGESMITVYYTGTPDASVMVAQQAAGVQFPSGTTPETSNLGYYPYLVHTGAGWAGTIGKSVVRYTLADDFNGFGVDQVTRNYAEQSWIPEARRQNLTSFTMPSDRVYQWTYSDYEPTTAHDTILAFVQISDWTESFDPWEATKASSWLKLDEFEYPAWAVRNGNPGDAWAEAVDGPGIGQWLDIPFGETREVRQLRVLTGYQKSATLYRKYNRPSRLRIDYSNGTSQEIALADEMGLQFFEADATADSAKVTILDVYKGTNERDETYLSEITFAEAAAPKFDTFEAVTGIAPPEGFEEPDALKAITAGSEGDDGDADGGASDGPTGLEGVLGDDAMPEWLLPAIVGGACCCGLVLVGVIVLVVVLVRRRKAPSAASAPAPPA